MNHNEVDIELDIKSPCHSTCNLHVKSKLNNVNIVMPPSRYTANYRYTIVCPECGRVLDEAYHMFTVDEPPVLELPDVEDGSKEYIDIYAEKLTATRRADGILSCPLCGKLDYVGMERMDDGDGIRYRVACHDEDCGERGRWCSTQAEAIHDWNCEYV